MKARTRTLEKERAYRKQPHIQKKARERFLRKLGFTTALFEDLFDAQDGCCAICKKKFTGHRTARCACADHDHLTGEARGVLCSKCNSALGLFDDSIANLKAAIMYLEKPSVEWL